MQEGRRRLVVFGSTLLVALLIGIGYWSTKRPPAVPPEMARPTARPSLPGRSIPRLLAPSGRVVASPQESTPAPGTITGRVIASSTGHGIAGAEIAFDVAAGIAAVIAGADGGFRFETAEPGRIRLASVRATGFFPFAPELGRSRTVFQLAPGFQVKDVVLTLEPKVNFTGKVVDQNEQPVAAARVAVVDLGRVQAELEPLGLVFHSDAQGNFVFQAPEESELEATHPAFRTARVSIGLMVQTTRSLTIRLRPPDAQARADRTERTAGPDAKAADRGAIAGRVVDADQRPVTAFTVIAEALKGPLIRTRIGAFTSFDHEGRFVIEDLAAGRVALTAVAQDGAPSQEQIVSVTETGPTGVVLVLRRGRTLRGKVLAEGSGTAIEGARVTVEGNPGASEMGLAVSQATTTRSDGSFELRNLAAGNHALLTWAQGFHGRILAGITIPADTEPQPVEVALSPVRPGEAPTLELAGIGTVLAAEGDFLRITKVIEGGGAAQAGVKAGDRIISIDGRPVVEIGFAASVELIRGPVGTPVRLGLRRDDTPAVVDLTVIRRKMRV